MYIFHSWSNIQDIVSPDLIAARYTTNLPVYIRIIQSHKTKKICDFLGNREERIGVH